MFALWWGLLAPAKEMNTMSNYPGDTGDVDSLTRTDLDIPEYYYRDRGQAYWLFGDILFSAPLDQYGNVVWPDMGEVEDPYPGTEKHTALAAALRAMEAATVEL